MHQDKSHIVSVFLLVCAQYTKAQFGDGPQNANPFVDMLISEVVNASNETIPLKDEEFVLVVDLFIVRPELHLEVTGLEMDFNTQDFDAICFKKYSRKS